MNNKSIHTNTSKGYLMILDSLNQFSADNFESSQYDVDSIELIIDSIESIIEDEKGTPSKERMFNTLFLTSNIERLRECIEEINENAEDERSDEEKYNQRF